MQLHRLEFSQFFAISPFVQNVYLQSSIQMHTYTRIEVDKTFMWKIIPGN